MPDQPKWYDRDVLADAIKALCDEGLSDDLYRIAKEARYTCTAARSLVERAFQAKRESEERAQAAADRLNQFLERIESADG